MILKLTLDTKVSFKILNKYILVVLRFMVSYLKSLFERTELVLLIAVIVPLIFNINVHFLESWISFILGIVMFLSIRPFFSQKINALRDWKKILLSILLSYVLLSGVYLFVASLFFPLSSDYFIGFLLLAIVPPAVSIIPLCYLTKCDIKVADTAIFVSYLLALIIIPLTSYLVFGKNFDFLQLLSSLAVIIVVPTILAYFSRHSKSKIFSYTKLLTGLLIGLVLLISVSLNRSSLLNVADVGIRHILFINLGVIFGLGLLTYYISKKFVSQGDAIDYMLYATQKNEATGIAIALVLFNHAVAIPLISAVVVQFLFFIFFERFVLRHYDSKTG